MSCERSQFSVFTGRSWRVPGAEAVRSRVQVVCLCYVQELACVVCSACSWPALRTLMGCGGVLEAATRPHRRVRASWRVDSIIRHTGTDGIREHRRQHCVLESERGYVLEFAIEISRSRRIIHDQRLLVGNSKLM